MRLAVVDEALEREGDEAAGDENIFAMPPKIYLALTVVALILMIYSTLLVTVHFLDLTQGQDLSGKISFMVPGPKAK